MRTRFRLCLASVAIAIGLMYFAPTGFAQEQQRATPAPSEVNPPQTPSETPSTGEQGYTKQKQNDGNTLPSVPETYAERSSFSWGALVFGLTIGGVIGYLIGRQSRHVDVRRNRAA
jgi:hypothetical protein